MATVQIWASIFVEDRNVNSDRNMTSLLKITITKKKKSCCKMWEAKKLLQKLYSMRKNYDCCRISATNGFSSRWIWISTAFDIMQTFCIVAPFISLLTENQTFFPEIETTFWGKYTYEIWLRFDQYLLCPRG